MPVGTKPGLCWDPVCSSPSDGPACVPEDMSQGGFATLLAKPSFPTGVPGRVGRCGAHQGIAVGREVSGPSTFLGQWTA